MELWFFDKVDNKILLSKKDWKAPIPQHGDIVTLHDKNGAKVDVIVENRAFDDHLPDLVWLFVRVITDKNICQTVKEIEPTAYSQTVKSFSKPKPSPISFKAKAKIDFVSDGIQFEKGKEYDVKELDSFFDKEVERRSRSWDDFRHFKKHYRLGIVNGSITHYFYDKSWAKSNRLASFEDFFEKFEELSEN